MDVMKEARRDAKEYARAQMFYGEGAGNRRKLIYTTVESKAHRDPTYARAFEHELARQDMAEHATKARHERERKDAASSVKKTANALATGKYQNMETSILILIVGGYLLHKNGIDKKVWEKAKYHYANLKARLNKEPVVMRPVVIQGNVSSSSN